VVDAYPLIIVAQNIKGLIGTGINESVAYSVLKSVVGVNPGVLNDPSGLIVKRNVGIINYNPFKYRCTV
jgi:hypothetical protein